MKNYFYLFTMLGRFKFIICVAEINEQLTQQCFNV